MKEHLTICFTTSRKDPKLNWFFESLQRQVSADDKIKIVIVDFNANDITRYPWNGFEVVHSPPKPTVWQGKWRLTKEDWWATANARNTGLCLAPDGWLAYVDDLSVLLPGWLGRVNQAMEGNYIVCGAYKKVKNLVVEKGEVKTFTNYPEGMDSRFNLAKEDVSVCPGGWLFGCSLAAPVEALLTVGGWPEFADGLKFEDCLMGICLTNAGFTLKYDRHMMTYESEELHHGGLVFKASSKGTGQDTSAHRALGIAEQSKYFPNYYDGGMRKLRQDVLGGMPFPIDQIPQHDWYDGQPICEM